MYSLKLYFSPLKCNLVWFVALKMLLADLLLDKWACVFVNCVVCGGWIGFFPGLVSEITSIWAWLLDNIKGARSCNFRQFQHWSSGHRINWNNKITAQNYRRTRTKHRKARKGQGWTKLGRIEMDCIWVNLYQFISKCHLNHRKIILSCYVAVILKMKDFCSASLTFRAHN